MDDDLGLWDDDDPDTGNGVAALMVLVAVVAVVAAGVLLAVGVVSLAVIVFALG